jgi:DNA-binding protein H-NS
MSAETTLDLASFSDKELEALVPKIEKELARRFEAKKKEAIDTMRAVAESVGMTPEELLGVSAGGGRRRRGGGGKRAQGAWAHPDDASLVYRGGRKPAWMKELAKAGREAVKVE